MKNKNYVTKQFGFNLNEPDKNRALQFLKKCDKRQSAILAAAVCEFLDKYGIEDFDYASIKFFLEQYEKKRQQESTMDTIFVPTPYCPVPNDCSKELQRITATVLTTNTEVQKNSDEKGFKGTNAVASVSDKSFHQETEHKKNKKNLLADGANAKMKNALQMFSGM